MNKALLATMITAAFALTGCDPDRTDRTTTGTGTTPATQTPPEDRTATGYGTTGTQDTEVRTGMGQTGAAPTTGQTGQAGMGEATGQDRQRQLDAALRACAELAAEDRMRCEREAREAHERQTGMGMQDRGAGSGTGTATPATAHDPRTTEGGTQRDPADTRTGTQRDN